MNYEVLSVSNLFFDFLVRFACSLLRHDMHLFHLSLSRDVESKNQLKVNILLLFCVILFDSQFELGSMIQHFVVSQAMKDDILNQIEASYQVTINEKTKDDPFAVVVDGKALEIALSNDIRDDFLQLAVNCASVICCRISPKQKALVCWTRLCS